MTSDVAIRLCKIENGGSNFSNDLPAGVRFVTPGEEITDDAGFMRGHGTYLRGDKLCASVAGVVDRVNKLISVQAHKTRYIGEVGDVIVGRVVTVGQKRWLVDTFSRLNSVLLLSSVNLPGGELRRRSTKDELLMREYLVEGDLVTAEVQSIYGDGSLSLHTRNLKYGKLPGGLIVKVAPSLVKRCKSHYHNLPFGATVILGNNGYVWIGSLMSDEIDLSLTRDDTKVIIPMADREIISRTRNCLLALANNKVPLFDTSLVQGYEASLQFPVKDILKHDTQVEIADETRRQLATRT